jgi:hypothetical protein
MPTVGWITTLPVPLAVKEPRVALTRDRRGSEEVSAAPEITSSVALMKVVGKIKRMNMTIFFMSQKL